MTTSQSTLRVCRENDRLIFHMMGLGRMAEGLTLRRFAEQALAEEPLTIWVDLRECVYMDSTFIGSLLYLDRKINRESNGRFALLSPSPQCYELLAQMDLHEVFDIRKDIPAVGEEGMIIHCELDSSTFKDHVVEAHEELAKVPVAGCEQFRQVMRVLRKEMGDGKK